MAGRCIRLSVTPKIRCMFWRQPSYCIRRAPRRPPSRSIQTDAMPTTSPPPFCRRRRHRHSFFIHTHSRYQSITDHRPPSPSPPVPPATMTSSSSFFQQLSSRSQSINSLLCIGLDPHFKELNLPPTANETERAEAAYQFCQRIIDATHPYTVCYKPNVAFFEAIGTKLGCATLRRVIDSIPSDIPILLDVKRGDIGTTASAYADACYDTVHGLNGDGVTLSPLMGWDSVEPFITGAYLLIPHLIIFFVTKREELDVFCCRGGVHRVTHPPLPSSRFSLCVVNDYRIYLLLLILSPGRFNDDCILSPRSMRQQNMYLFCFGPSRTLYHHQPIIF